MMKVLAIDASTKSTGISVFQNMRLVHYECISATSGDTIERIKIMVERIKWLCYQYQPTNIVIQQVLPQDVKHNQTVYKALIYLQAAIILELHNSKVPIELVVASHWRKICGIKTGRGIKRETLKAESQALVKSKYGISVNDDISDAICLGMAYIEQNGSAF